MLAWHVKITPHLLTNCLSHSNSIPKSLTSYLFSISFISNNFQTPLQQPVSFESFTNAPVGWGYTVSFNPNQKRENMNTNSNNSNSVNAVTRCQHIFDNGTRCRLSPPSADSFFCSRHAHLPQNLDHEADITAYFPEGLENLDSATNINNALSRVLILLAKGRISSRRAAVLAYLSNQLLRTLPMMDRELAADQEDAAPPKFIFDWARPRHPQPLSDTTHKPVTNEPVKEEIPVQ
jgi:hypothetical protein